MAVQLPPVWCRMHLSQVCWEVQLSLAFELPKYHPYCPCEFMPLLCNLLTVLVGFQEGVNADIFNHHLYPKLLVYNLFLLSLFWIFFRPVCFVLIFFFLTFFGSHHQTTPPAFWIASLQIHFLKNASNTVNTALSTTFGHCCVLSCSPCSQSSGTSVLCSWTQELFSSVLTLHEKKKCPHYFSQQANK